MNILIFDAEREAGLEEQITKASAVSYLSALSPANLLEENKEMLKAYASEKNLNINIDGLFPTQSILVSTVWNLNDDVFDKYETWVARYTPVHKYTNNNHVETEIVGHMTGSWAIDESGNLIDDDIAADKLPDIFHILNAAVIYTEFSDPELRARSQKLIEEINAGKKFVSMEARFRGFDYAVVGSDGVMQIVQRNEKTAFLTKHLRAYGGSGKYENHKIGRLLRNITFSGKGYVDTPANPGSIIFDKDTTFKFISKSFVRELKTTSGVLNNQKPNNGEINQMSQELETKVNELTTANDTLKKDLDGIKVERDTLKASIDELTSTKTSLEAKIAELTTANQTLQTEVDTYKKNEIKARRVGVLVAGGYTSDEADKKVALFADLNDDQFKAISDELVESKKNSKGGTSTANTGEKTNLDNVKPEQVVVPSVPDESTAATRAALGDLFEKMVKSKKNTKATQNA